MNDGAAPPNGGWFEGVGRADRDGAADAIPDGTASEPRDWPAVAELVEEWCGVGLGSVFAHARFPPSSVRLCLVSDSFCFIAK